MPSLDNGECLEWVNKRHKDWLTCRLKLKPHNLILIKDLEAVVDAGPDGSAMRHALSQRVGPIVPVLEENECGQSAKQIRVDATAVAVFAWPSWFRCCRCGYGFRDRRQRRNGETPILWPHGDTPGLGQTHQSNTQRRVNVRSRI